MGVGETFWWPGRKGGVKTYELALAMVREVAPLERRLGRKDKDLAHQLRRSMESVPLNIAEGMYSRGNNRAARLTDAMASAKETVACLQVAEAASYFDAKSIEKPLDQLDHLVAALWKMVHDPWR